MKRMLAILLTGIITLALTACTASEELPETAGGFDLIHTAVINAEGKEIAQLEDFTAIYYEDGTLIYRTDRGRGTEYHQLSMADGKDVLLGETPLTYYRRSAVVPMGDKLYLAACTEGKSGVDRLYQIDLAGKSIREVIAYPNSAGASSMTAHGEKLLWTAREQESRATVLWEYDPMTGESRIVRTWDGSKAPFEEIRGVCADVTGVYALIVCWEDPVNHEMKNFRLEKLDSKSYETLDTRILEENTLDHGSWDNVVYRDGLLCMEQRSDAARPREIFPFRYDDGYGTSRIYNRYIHSYTMLMPPGEGPIRLLDEKVREDSSILLRSEMDSQGCSAYLAIRDEDRWYLRQQHSRLGKVGQAELPIHREEGKNAIVCPLWMDSQGNILLSLADYNEEEGCYGQWRLTEFQFSSLNLK